MGGHCCRAAGVFKALASMARPTLAVQPSPTGESVAGGSPLPAGRYRCIAEGKGDKRWSGSFRSVTGFDRRAVRPTRTLASSFSVNRLACMEFR